MKKTIFCGICAVTAGLFFVRTVYSNDLFISGEAESNGLSVVVSAPDGFTGRVEIYACADLISNSWRIVTQNLRPTGDAPAKWYAETTNDSGFFIVGNMDMDNDGDGLPDAQEKYVHKTNPNTADSDADEMPDGWELQHLLNPLNDADATSDPDGDELNNLDEYQEGTNPTLSDTDGDGFIDPYDLHACSFDYPVAGKAIFNMVATGYFRDYLPAIGFSADGAQTLTLRWSDSFWYPADYRNEGRIIEAGSSQLHWTGEKFSDQNQNGWEYINLYKDNFWYDLGLRNWDPPLTHPMCYFYIHPPGVPNYEFLDGDFGGLDEYLAAHDELVLPYPEAGNRFIEILSENRDGSYTNYLCMMFSYNYSALAPPICLITDFGNMRAVDNGVEAYTVGSGDAPRQLKMKFKFVFDQPVTNRIIKWITYYYDYVETAYVDYAVHQCEVTGKENGENILIAEPSDHLRNMSMIVPAVDLNGDFDLDGDVDGADTVLRAPAGAALTLSPTGQEEEVPGTGAVAVTVSGNMFEAGMPDSVLRIGLSGAEPGERFRLWSGAAGPLIHPMMVGGGDDPELLEDPLLLIDTEWWSGHEWPVGGSPGYDYEPGFPKTLYLECVSCGATNDGRAVLELIYEYNGEEICSAALPITIIRSKLIPDWNHDRTIDMADQTQSTNNAIFRFWINDDDDNGDISEGDSDVPGQGGLFDNANYKDDQVNGRSDLLDFSPVWLNLHDTLAVLPTSGGAEYKLRHADEAVRFVYTDLTCTNAADFLTTELTTCGASANQNSYEADSIKVTDSGVILASAFLDKIAANPDKGILMLEGIAATTNALVLEIWQDDSKVFETELVLSIAGVEDMYRWVNLRSVAGGSEDRSTNTNEPSNNPDSLCANGKHVVFVHGFNTPESGARAWNAEVFKRLYQSGSRAMYTAVIWRGDESGVIDPLYQENVNNAFLTAPYFAQYVNALSGDKGVLAHSLGNMVVSSAIQDHSLNVNACIMLDAAVATECYDPGTFNAATNNNPMLHVDWRSYQPKTWASKWHELFSAPDSRANLTWGNRFPAVLPNAYNFYSSEDEVFEIYTNVLNIFTGVDLDFAFAFLDDTEHYSWHKQELFKGLDGSLVHSLGATDWAGWGFHKNILGFRVYSAEEANVASNEVLVAEPVFRKNPDDMFSSQIDPAIVNGVLAKGIPALSYATGVTNLFSLPAGRNYNMVSEKPVVWPRNHETYGRRWLHSDIKDIAYPYVYKTFWKIVEKGELQ